MIRPYRKPLVIIAPKMLLRHPSTLSSLSEMEPGTYFKPVIMDTPTNLDKVKRVNFDNIFKKILRLYLRVASMLYY